MSICTAGPPQRPQGRRCGVRVRRTDPRRPARTDRDRGHRNVGRRPLRTHRGPDHASQRAPVEDDVDDQRRRRPEDLKLRAGSSRRCSNAAGGSTRPCMRWSWMRMCTASQPAASTTSSTSTRPIANMRVAAHVVSHALVVATGMSSTAPGGSSGLRSATRSRSSSGVSSWSGCGDAVCREGTWSSLKRMPG